MPELPRLRAHDGRPLRVGHLTTVDMSLALLLGTELRADVSTGLETFAISAPGSYVADVERLGATHVPIEALTRSWRPGQDLVAARDLANVIRDLRLDVLHTHNPKTGVLGRLIGRALQVPVVVNTCHGLWINPSDPALKKLAVLGVEALAAQASHAELYQNAEDRTTLQRFVEPRRSRVVGNGIDLGRFRRDEQAGQSLRREIGVEPDELLVGGVGRRVSEKGIGEFVAAARALAGKARFVWIGPEDPDKPDALTESDGPVTFLGPRTDMVAVYSALDVFALPSHREGFSRSGMEAAACRSAMVLTDIRGCREIGVNEEHLLLVPPADADALAAAIDRLLVDDTLRERLSRSASDRAAKEFDQLEVVWWSLRTYEAVARRKGLGWTRQETS